MTLLALADEFIQLQSESEKLNTRLMRHHDSMAVCELLYDEVVALGERATLLAKAMAALPARTTEKLRVKDRVVSILLDTHLEDILEDRGEEETQLAYSIASDLLLGS